MDLTSDEAIAATNDDASVCKYQAVTKNYYKDGFIGYLLPAKLKKPSNKAPEINMGYFIRSVSVSYIIEQFLKAHPDGQIISIGAGYDSLYWRLRSYAINSQSQAPIKYIEVDMSAVVAYKVMNIKRNPELNNFLINVKYKGDSLHSAEYDLISYDLRQVRKESFKQKLVEDCHLDFKRPVLCLAECVLVYMPIEDSDSLIKWFSDNCEKLTIVNYEQCNMGDRFGDIMMSNMNERHCDLLGVRACKSLETQMDRFRSNGLQNASAWTMATIYNNLYLPAEIERIRRIEALDEGELLSQLLEHYCIVVASNSSTSWIEDSDTFWKSECSGQEG